MKLTLLTLATLLALAASEIPSYHKQVDSTFVDRQKKILDVFSGLSVYQSDSKYNHVHQEFTFNKPEYYTNSEVFEGFVRGYKRGFLPRDGVFTMNNYKARHDTFKLFEIFYFAKDFDTFLEIAKWAKNEMHPMQFGYAFTIAVFHRADTRGMYVPPNYETYPHYFVPSEIMRQADLASFHDVEYRLFEVNSTGHEHSWYRDTISGSSKDHPRWNGHDFESRIAYFREDPSLGHWYSMTMAKFATWLSPKKYPGIHFQQRGKHLYTVHKWLLSRYNLERMADDLPFVAPFDWDSSTVGYNPRLVDSMGRPFVSRPDSTIPRKANPFGFWLVDKIEERISEAIDIKAYWEFKNESFVQWTEETGVDILGKIIFGERDGIGRYYYKPWFFHLMEAVNDMIHSSNEREYTNSVFGKFMTMVRDPAFFQILASMDEWFETYTSSYAPYTSEQLNFPGVKVEKVEFDKLMTFFERWEYEITQGVAVRKPEDRENRKYMASQYRLSHRPFQFNITVTSERAQDATIRVFFGPKKNIDHREMPLNQARHAFFLSSMFKEKLKPGVNVITKNSDTFFSYETYEGQRSFRERLNKATESGKPFYSNTMSNCGLPYNLALPRGEGSGKDYQVFVMVEPTTPVKNPENHFYHCGMNEYLSQHPITYPFDRTIRFDEDFKQPNMLFQDVMIYHKFESDLNRPYSV